MVVIILWRVTIMICVVKEVLVVRGKVSAATKVSNQRPAGVMMIENLEMVLVVSD